ncbi:hypothetical protein Tco_1233605, partial [Tanacetum coccineum]
NETVVSKSKINRDEVIIEDWTSDDEDGVLSKLTGHLIKDCDFYDKSVLNLGLRMWSILGREKSNQYGIMAKGSISTVRPVRPVSTARPLASKIAQSKSVIRPNHPRLDIVRPKASNTPIKRSYFTQPVYRPKDFKSDVKTFGVKNMTTVGTRAVVSKGKVENVLKKTKWGNPEILLQDHAVVDSCCSSHMTGNKAYQMLQTFLPKDLMLPVHMANLKYSEKHNMVAFLKKPNESVGFTEVVDFLKVRTLANGTQQLVASIDSKEYNITEASVRSKLQLRDATGIHNLSDAEIYAGLATLGPKSGGWDQFGSTIATALISSIDSKEYTITEASVRSKLQLADATGIHNLSDAEIYAGIATLGGQLWDQNMNISMEALCLLEVIPKKVKSLETTLKRKSKKGRFQEEEISPTILEAAKTLSKVASQGVSKEKSTDKGKRYMRRGRSMAKKIDTGLDAREEVNTNREKINTGIEEVSTGSTKIDSGTASKRSQREGNAPMVEEDIQASHKTKEQMRQEQAGLEEVIKLQAQLDEEVAKQIHLDKMIAQRMAEEEALTEQKKKRKYQVKFEAQFYIEED